MKILPDLQSTTKVQQVRSHEKLGKQDLHYDAKEVVEHIPKLSLKQIKKCLNSRWPQMKQLKVLSKFYLERLLFRLIQFFFHKSLKSVRSNYRKNSINEDVRVETIQKIFCEKISICFES